jgi:hypothetical protein
LGCGIPLGAAAGVSRGCGWIYHLTVITAVIAYTLVGLALARSRLRLSVMVFEVNPSSMIIGLMIFAPFALGFGTAMTVGWGGFLGLIGLAFIAVRMDVTPQAPKWMPPPVPDMPAEEA